MSDSENDREQPLVITQGDLARVANDPVHGLSSESKPVVPWWARVLGWVLAFSFPLLCIFAIGIRVSNRSKEPAFRAAWNAFLSTLLMASGMATLAAGAYFWSIRRETLQTGISAGPSVMRPMQRLGELPSFPSPRPMTPIEIAARTKPLAFIVSPDVSGAPEAGYLEVASVGAAVLLMASDDGLLLGTNRHVIELPALFRLGRNPDRALVISGQWEFAHARVIGRHDRYDLALLWVAVPGGDHHYFRQPITPYHEVPLGDPVFVLGHPQRLFFTLSNGLVSRLDGSATLQLSAPVSPGNSGGPVYDTQGNLLGIVTSKVDQSSSPNAENLNFATRADAFLTTADWKFLGDGKERLDRFITGSGKTN